MGSCEELVANTNAEIEEEYEEEYDSKWRLSLLHTLKLN